MTDWRERMKEREREREREREKIIELASNNQYYMTMG